MPAQPNRPQQDDEFGRIPPANNASLIPNITAEEMAAHFVTLRKQVSEIHNALVGSAYAPRGLIKRLADIEDQVEAHDRKLVLWSSLIAFFGVAVVWVKDFITHK